MPYGILKCDTVTFTDAGVDKSVSISGLVQNPTFSGNVTVAGTLSGVTVTGTTANFTSGNFTNISVGTYTITSGVFSAGSATNPSISFTSDPNTGIYSPGADQVAISTNGTGRLFVNSSGQVGIGGSPAYMLDITTGAFNDVARFTGYNAGTLLFRNSSTDLCEIRAESGDSLAIGAGGTEHLRITSDGKVGLGTSTPTNYGAGITSFSINGSAGGVADFYFNGVRQGWIGTMGSNQMVIDTAGAAIPLALKTNNNTAITIDTSQRVGVGTTSPLTLLDVRQGTNRRILFTDNASYASNGIVATNDSGSETAIAIGGSPIQFVVGATERARIDSSGRLLVGTSSTSSNNRLVVQSNTDSSTGPATLILAKGDNAPSSSATLGLLRFGGSTHVNSAEVYAFRDGGTWTAGSSLPTALAFSTTADGASSPTERMRISQNGVVTVQNGAVAVIGTLTDGATITPDFAANCNFTVTLGGSRTLANPTNITAGQSGSIFIVQDATGSRTLSWGSYWDFPGGTAPTLTTAANAVDRVDFVVRSSTSIHAVFTANYS